MKYFPLLALLALTASCKDETVDSQFTIEEGTSKQVATNATVTVSTIQNNLCPPNAVCIRAGEVLVDLIATQEGNSTTVSLCKGPDCLTVQNGKPARTTISVGGRTWTIELVDALRTTPEKAILNIQIQ